MKLKQKLLICVFLLLVIFPVFSQNALCPPNLSVFDVVVVDETLKSSSETNFESNYLNEDLSEKTISELIWEKLTTKDFKLYRFDFVPDIFSIKEEQDLTQWVNGMDKSQLVNMDHNIRSIIFFDEWSLDAEKFVFTKELAGYCPIKLHQRQADVTGHAPVNRIPLGIIRFPGEKRKFFSRLNNKNLIPVKKIAYEFLMVNEYWLKAVANNNAIAPYNGGPSLFFKENNFQWSEFHARKIIDVIFDRIHSNKRMIYDLDKNLPVDINQIHKELFPEEYELSDNEVMDQDGFGIEIDSITKIYELKENIYSLIFFEEWSLDTSSLYINKKVTAVAPVYWKTEWDDSTWGPIVDESGNPVYTKTPIFKMYFNSYD